MQTTRKKRNNNAITGRQLLSKKHKIMQFTGPHADTIGTPEWGESISIQGASSQGKTHYAFQLVQYLANSFGPVLYNSIEEGAKASFKKRYADYDLANCKYNVLVLNSESMLELKERLRKRNAPKIVVIDSITFFEKDASGDKLVDTRDYKQLIHEFADVLFIALVHEENGRLTSRTAEGVVRISGVKLRVEGCRVFVKASRCGGGAHYDVFADKAAAYWDNAGI